MRVPGRLAAVVGVLFLVTPALADQEEVEGLRLSLPKPEGYWARGPLVVVPKLTLAPELVWGGSWLEAPPSLVLGGTEPSPHFRYSRAWLNTQRFELTTFSEAEPMRLGGGDGRSSGEFSSGVEWRVPLGGLGPVKRVNVFGRAEALSPSLITKRSHGRLRVGLEGAF